MFLFGEIDIPVQGGFDVGGRVSGGADDDLLEVGIDGQKLALEVGPGVVAVARGIADVYDAGDVGIRVRVGAPDNAGVFEEERCTFGVQGAWAPDVEAGVFVEDREGFEVDLFAGSEEGEGE